MNEMRDTLIESLFFRAFRIFTFLSGKADIFAVKRICNRSLQCLMRQWFYMLMVVFVRLNWFLPNRVLPVVSRQLSHFLKGYRGQYITPEKATLCHCGSWR